VLAGIDATDVVVGADVFADMTMVDDVGKLDGDEVVNKERSRYWKATVIG
jgi:hypothetical protein